jgi:hypothetical protein
VIYGKACCSLTQLNERCGLEAEKMERKERRSHGVKCFEHEVEGVEEGGRSKSEY